MNSVFIVEQHGDHIYEVEEKTLASRCTPVTACNHCIKLNSKVIDLKKMLHEKEKELEKLKSELEGSKIQKKEQSNPVLSYSQVEDNEKKLKFYTGLQNKKVFEWIMNKIKDKIAKLQYYQGKKSFIEKNYQTSQKKNSGRKPSLSPENCFFLTLLRLRVGLPEQDTAFRFGISQALVSRMLVTWISFLARELSCLMYWPDRKNVHRFYPQCFQKYKYVIGIIDCNEGILQKPSVVKTSAGTYPLY